MGRFKLIIAPGLVMDDTGYSSQGRWVDGNNMIPWGGTMQAVGEQRTLTNVGVAISGTPRALFSWIENSGIPLLALGTDTNLYALHSLSASAYNAADITPSGFIGGSTTNPIAWSFDNFGETLIACARSYDNLISHPYIYQWSLDVGVAAARVTNSPAKSNHILVTDERQILAFGTNEESGGAFNPRLIRGSDIEIITDWSASSADSAFEIPLEDKGEIVTAAKIGGYVAVWTTESLFLGQYIGAADQIYRFDRVASDCGAFGKNVVYASESGAFWLGKDLQFRSWQVGGLPQLIPNPLRAEELIVESDGGEAAVEPALMWLSYNSDYQDYRLNYSNAEDSGDAPKRFISFNLADGAWSKGDTGVASQARTASNLITAQRGVARHAVLNTGTVVFNGIPPTGNNISWSIESGDIEIDPKDGKRMVVEGCWPDFKDQTANITMTLFFRDYPQSTAVTKGPYTLTAGMEKLDFIAEGRLLRVKLAGTGGSGGKPTRLGNLTFDVKVASTQ